MREILVRTACMYVKIFFSFGRILAVGNFETMVKA